LTWKHMKCKEGCMTFADKFCTQMMQQLHDHNA